MKQNVDMGQAVRQAFQALRAQVSALIARASETTSCTCARARGKGGGADNTVNDTGDYNSAVLRGTLAYMLRPGGQRRPARKEAYMGLCWLGRGRRDAV